MPEMTKEDRKTLLLDFKATAENGSITQFKRMSKAERFKVGDQWDWDLKQYAKSKHKHTLTINRILPTVLQVVGTEVGNPRDIRVVNTKGGSATVARVRSALVKHTMDTSNARRKKTQTFDDGVTTGVGYIGADLTYTDDPSNADIIIRKYDPFMVLVDKSRRKYDLNEEVGGCKYIILSEWEDKGKLEARYPKKKIALGEANLNAHQNQSQGMFASIISFMFDSKNPGDIRDDYRDQTDKEHELSSFSMTKFNYRKDTYWWKKWKKGVYLQRLDDPLNYLSLTNKGDIAKAKELAEANPEKVRVIDKDREGRPLVIPILNRTIMVGDVELEHVEDPFRGFSMIPVAIFNPYFINGYEFGLVENLIGPQEQVNWSWSMELNLISKLANTGWKIVKDVALTGGGMLGNFLKDHGSEDGVVIEEKSAGNVSKLEMNQFPLGFDILTEKGSRHIAEISNVRLESPQTDKDRVAAAIRLKQASAFTGSALLFSNYDYTMELLGQIVDSMITRLDVYSEDEIRAVVDEEDLIDDTMLATAREQVIAQISQSMTLSERPPEPDPVLFQKAPPEIQQVILAQFQAEMEEYSIQQQQVETLARQVAQAMLLDEIRNRGTGRYSTKVSLAASAETMRAVKTLEIFELNKVLIDGQQVPVDRELLVDATDVANKEEIIARGRQREQQLLASGPNVNVNR